MNIIQTNEISHLRSHSFYFHLKGIFHMWFWWVELILNSANECLNLPCISVHMPPGRVSPGYLSFGFLKAFGMIKDHASW